MKSVIAYYRVSTAKQGQSGLGLDAQRSTVQAYCVTHHATIAAEFIEVQSGKDDDRPQLREALRSAKAMRATLVVAKLDRLARSARFLDDIVAAGTDVAFCNLPDMPPGPTGRFMVQMMACIAELEAGMISERTKAALREAKERGTVLGGYRGVAPTPKARAEAAARRKARADKAALALVPKLRELQAAGCVTYDDISRALNDENVPTSTGVGRWHPMTVRKTIERLKAIEQREVNEARERTSGITGRFSGATTESETSE